MSVQAGPIEKRYVTNGVSLIYTVPFLVIDAGDLQIILNGVPVTSGFTLTGVGNPTSSITFAVAPPASGDLYLFLSVPFQRLVDYQLNGDFLSPTVNRDYDRIWQALKQLLRFSTRTLTLGLYDVDGQGAYRANNNRIQDLGDPIANQDATNKQWVQQFIAAIIGVGQGNINSAANVLYLFPDGSIHPVQDLSNMSDFARGLAGIGYMGRNAAAAFSQIGVSPFDYGAVGNFVHDDSVALAAAINAAKTLRRPLLWYADFAAIHVDGNSLQGVTIKCGGTLTGLATTAQESVLTIRNASDVVIEGRLVVAAGWNTNYACGVAIYTDNGSQVSRIDMYNVSVVGAQLGFRIGRRSEPDALISEFTIYGGNFYGCPSAYEVIGTQTVINFIGCKIITGVEGAPAAVATEWNALARTAIRSFGASCRILGGEALITDVTTGFLFDNRPIASSTYGNRYGKMDVSCTIESASPICLFWNPESIGSLVAGAGSAKFRDCDGIHTQNTAALIIAYDDFTGKIIAKDNTIFFPGTRTIPNISVGGSPCKIVADENSFGQGFMTGFAAIIGGQLSFSFQKILEVTSPNQTIAAGVSSAPLVFKTLAATPGNARFGGGYNTANGIYTVPASGLKSVHVGLNLDQGTTRPNSSIVLQVNGVPLYTVGGNGDRYINASWELGELAAGTTLQFLYLAGSSTSSFNFSSNGSDRFNISARA